MGAKVNDELAESGLSRAQKYQKRNIKNGKCALCPRKLHKWNRCLKHYQRARKDYRKHYLKTRNLKIDVAAKAA